MKKITLFLMLLCISVCAHAQLLWKVSGKDLAQPSYVFGSHHLSPLSIVDSIAGFKPAMDEVQQVYGEIVMEDMMKPEILMKIQQKTVLPGDTTLTMLYSKEKYDTLSQAVKSLMGVDLKMFDKIAPVALNVQMAVFIGLKSVEGFNPQQQLDMWMQSEAKKNGKPIGGLETVESQIEVLYGSKSFAEQADELYCTVTNLDFVSEQTKVMTEAYIGQDLKAMQAAMERKLNNECDTDPEVEDKMIYDRNTAWVNIMPKIMEAKPTMFVVGAGHLPGERGVLQLLQNCGYTVEPVK